MSLKTRVRSLERRAKVSGIRRPCVGCGGVAGRRASLILNQGEEERLGECPVCGCYIDQDGKVLDRLVIIGPTPYPVPSLPESIQAIEEEERRA